MSLTPGAIERICSGGDVTNDGPTVQVLNIKKVSGAAGPERYRIIVSDGRYYAQGMLATQINTMVTSGELTELCLVRVHKALANKVQAKVVVILLQLEHVGPHSVKIGEPTECPINANGGVAANAAAPGMVNNNVSANRPGTAMYNNNKSNNMYNNNSPRKVENSNGGGANPYNRLNSGGNPYGGGGGGGGSAPIVRNNGMATDQQFTPIASLNPYANRWTIKARITNKGDIRTWSNARGEGSLFSLDLLDASGIDIKATFFKEAVDKFYNILEMDRVYTFSGGRIKAANVQYNTCKSPHELSFDQNSEIHQVADGDPNIAKQSFERIPIAKLSEIEPNSYVDLVGIVKSASECQSLISKKTQKELFKADLVVVDESCAEINVTVWGEKAKTAAQDYAGHPVVGFKRLKLGDYGGRSCSVSGGPVITNPDVPEAALLSNWWTSQGSSTAVKSLSGSGMGASRMDPLDQRKTLRDIKGDHLGFDEKPDYICVKGLFTFFKIRDEGPWYTACANPDPPCNNRCKATMTSDQSWHCERCGQTRDTCTRRYILSATIADDTCTTWVSLFNEQVTEVIGQELTADLLYEKYFAESSNPEENPIDDFNAIFNNGKFTEWVFKLKVKNEDVGGESRTKVTIYNLVPVDYVKESRDMIDAIAKMQ